MRKIANSLKCWSLYMKYAEMSESGTPWPILAWNFDCRKLGRITETFLLWFKTLKFMILLGKLHAKLGFQTSIPLKYENLKNVADLAAWKKLENIKATNITKQKGTKDLESILFAWWLKGCKLSRKNRKEFWQLLFKNWSKKLHKVEYSEN